jgi:hypothetical protein
MLLFGIVFVLLNMFNYTCKVNKFELKTITLPFGGRVMKAKITMSIFTALIMSACSSGYYASKSYDDVYSVSGKDKNSTAVTNESKSQQVVTKSAPADRKSDNLSDYEKYRKARENGELNDSSATTESYDTSSEADVASKEPEVESKEYYGNSYDDSYGGGYYYAPRFHRFYGYYSPYMYSYGWGFGMSYGWGDPWAYDFYDPYYYSYYPYGFGYGYYSPYYYGYGHGYYHGWYNSDYYGSYNHGGRGYNTRSSGNISSVRRSYPSSSGMAARSSSSRVTTRSAAGGAGARSSSVAGNSTRRMQYTRPAGTSTTARGAASANTGRRTYSPSYSKPRQSSQTYNNEGRTYSSERTSQSSNSGRSYTPSTSSSSRSSSSSSSSSYSRGSSSSSSGSASSSRSSSGSSSSSSGSSRSSGGSGGGGHSGRR